LFGTPEGKRRLCRCKDKDIIELDLKEVWWEDVNLIFLAQGFIVHGNAPSDSIKEGEFLD
jgi:hypothetical protein